MAQHPLTYAEEKHRMLYSLQQSGLHLHAERRTSNYYRWTATSAVSKLCEEKGRCIRVPMSPRSPQ